MPPIERAVSPMATVADPASFEAGLTTRAFPGVVSVLSHDVDPDGPHGAVTSEAVTAPATEPVRWRRAAPRSVTAITALPPGGTTTPSPAPENPGLVADAAAAPPAPVVARANDVAPVAGGPPALLDAPSAPAGDTTRPSAPLVGDATPTPPPPPVSPLVASASAEPDTPRANVSPTSPNPPRRLGLGAPLPAVQPPRPVQRAAADTATPHRSDPSRHSPGGPGQWRDNSEAPSLRRRVGAPLPPGVERVTSPSIEVTPPPNDGGLSTAVAPERSRWSEVVVQRREATGTPPPRRSMPLVGSASVAGPRAAPLGTAPPAAAAPMAIPTDRGAVAPFDSRPTPEDPRRDAPAPRHEPIVQRQLVAAGGTTRPAPAADRTMPRAAVVSPPAEAPTVVSAGLATAESDGVVVFRTPDADAAPEVDAISGASPAAHHAAAPSHASSSATVPAGGGVDTKQLDVLAHAVYGRLRDQLKAELRLDRERSGRLVELGGA